MGRLKLEKKLKLNLGDFMKLNNDVYKVFIGEEAFTIITNCFKKEAFNNE